MDYFFDRETLSQQNKEKLENSRQEIIESIYGNISILLCNFN